MASVQIVSNLGTDLIDEEATRLYAAVAGNHAVILLETHHRIVRIKLSSEEADDLIKLLSFSLTPAQPA